MHSATSQDGPQHVTDFWGLRVTSILPQNSENTKHQCVTALFFWQGPILPVHRNCFWILTVLGEISCDFLARLNHRQKTKVWAVIASSGQVLSKVCIVRNVEDLYKIKTGQALVCEGTSPSWATAFSRISACLNDHSGTLSQAAIVSHEFGLPCVVALTPAPSP